MDDATRVSQDTSSLDELVETHIRSLANKLSLPHTLQEIEAEVAMLNDLIHAFKHKDELLEKLLDASTAQSTRSQIRESLEALNIKVAKDGTDLALLHAKSHQLLERSIYLITKAQHQINQEAHKYSGYALEACGHCKGPNNHWDTSCPICKGRGTVLVRQDNPQ
jgi:ABC-type transporter Mla subunit MlaD